MTYAILAIAAVLLAAQLPTLLSNLRSVTSDSIGWYLPWYHHILVYGRWRSIEGSFSNYTPPYIYMMSLVSLGRRFVREAVLVKLVTPPFILLSGWFAYDLCRKLGLTAGRALGAALLIMVAPEVWQNSFRWGQCDILYACFLIAFCRYMLTRQPGIAMMMFATAFAFKLQAIFAAPVLLALLLAGDLPLQSFLLFPVTYAVWMLPAAIAGRPLKDLLFVYAQQYRTYPQLSLDAPNLYFLIQPWFADRWFPYTSKIAVLFALAASLWAVAVYVRRKALHTGVGLVCFMTVVLLLVPYLLPRMHERYFFAGGLFAILLAVLKPGIETALIAALCQISAVLTYQQFFLSHGYHRRYFLLPVILTSTAMLLSAKVLLRLSNDKAGDRNLAFAEEGEASPV